MNETKLKPGKERIPRIKGVKKKKTLRTSCRQKKHKRHNLFEKKSHGS